MRGRPAFGDFIIYVDESGDHGIDRIDPTYPVFVLAFCIFGKATYTRDLVPALQRFKFDWFGHDIVVLHEAELRRQEPPFAFLKNARRRALFMDGLNGIMEAAPMTVVVAAIRKDRMVARPEEPHNPYELALQMCLERAREVLAARGQADRITHVVAEARGRREDDTLELEFRRIVDGKARFSQSPLPGFDLIFANKRVNSAGLQVADLITRPIGLHVLRPGQPNRAFDIIRPKIWTDPQRDLFDRLRDGLRVFPGDNGEADKQKAPV